MEAGHRELGACDWPRPPGRGSWSYAQTYKAQRLIDGGMGERLGYKSFEETTFGGGEEALEGGGLGLLPVPGTLLGGRGAHLILASGPRSLDAWVSMGREGA